MSNLNERIRRGTEAVLEFKDTQVDRIEMLGVAALRKVGLTPETSELIVEKVTAGISILTLSAVAVGAAYTVEQGAEKGISAVVEYVLPDPQIPNLIDTPAQDTEMHSGKIDIDNRTIRDIQ
jgi:hypothetical protein